MNKQIIKQRIKQSMTDYDFERYLGPTVKDKVKLYADLENYTFNQLLPNKIDYVIILVEDDVNNGHWCVITKDGYNKVVTWFDSYGIRPGGQLVWISAKQNKKLDNEPHDITNLLNEARFNGYKVIYNKKRFQSSKPGVNTCGRHIIFFLLSFLQKFFNLPDYIYYMESLEKQFNTDADHIVSQFIV